MEKIRRFLLILIFSLMLPLLSSCYRQTTIILPQGQTLPSTSNAPTESAVLSIPEASEPTSSVEDQASFPSEASKETQKNEASASQMQTEPQSSKPSQPQSSVDQVNQEETTAPVKTTTPTETTSPVETTTPVETTAPVEATTPAKTTTPVETAAPVETTTPVETTAPVETTTPAETAVTEETAPPTEPSAHPVYNISTHHIGSYEQSILEEINHHRADLDISTLSMSQKLSALAAIRAYECSSHFTHTRPDGRSWDTVLSDYGSSASTENILYASSGTAASLLVSTCLDSSTHSQNILNPDYSTVGIGIYNTGRYVFTVMIFS